MIGPGGIIGILGGGQLGRMLAVAASRLGLDCHIYAPEPDAIARSVARYNTTGEYNDETALKAFAQSCDVVTYEFENVPALTAKIAGQNSVLRPGSLALEVAQDRLTEKAFLTEKGGVTVVDFAKIDSLTDMRAAGERLGYPFIVKTRRFGYDGKGQIKLNTEQACEAAFTQLSGALIGEKFASFEREVSVVAARSASGDFAAYPLIENVHKNHILHQSICPAKTGAADRAQDMARAIMDALDYVGVMATEFFQMDDGSLRVNEIAPRVHNSGHFSQNAGCVDQFELHIRAICGWPLGSTTPLHTVEMTNLIGDEATQWEILTKDRAANIHLYGKGAARPGRKMGHVNRVLAPKK